MSVSRISNQQFFTPTHISRIVSSIAQEYSCGKDAIYFECCAGDGSIFNELPSKKRIGNEIDPKLCSLLKRTYKKNRIMCRDFLKIKQCDINVPASKLVIVTNPPYRGGFRQSSGKDIMWSIIRHAMALADTGVFLLPAGVRRMCSTSRHIHDRYVHMVHEKTWPHPVEFRYGSTTKKIRVVVRVYKRLDVKRKVCSIPNIPKSKFFILDQQNIKKANLFMLNWGSPYKLGELYTKYNRFSRKKKSPKQTLSYARMRFKRSDHGIPFYVKHKKDYDKLVKFLNIRRPIIQSYGERIAYGNNPNIAKKELMAILEYGKNVCKFYD